MSVDNESGNIAGMTQRDILIELRTLLKEFATKGEDHETRIRRLEERKFPLPTVAVLVAFASLIATAIMYVTQH